MSGAYYFDSLGRTTTENIRKYIKNQAEKGDKLSKLTKFIN